MATKLTIVPEEAYRMGNEGLSDKEIALRKAATEVVYHFAPEDGAEGYLGIFRQQLISDGPYIWVNITQYNNNPFVLRRIIAEAKAILQEYGGITFAEIAMDSKRNAKFAEFFGFKQVGQSGDVLTYKRIN